MKQFTWFFLLVCWAFFSQYNKLLAQQDPMYTQYMNNILSVNPAYAGSTEMLSLMVMSRNQWVSFEGAPVTQTFVMHAPIAKYNMGLGFSLLKDELGPISQTGAYLDYSYSIYFKENHYLSFGLKGGVNFYEAALTDLITVDPNDPVFANDISRNFLPNVGLGMYYHTPRCSGGISIPKLIENKINKNEYVSEYVSKEKIHLFLFASYVFDVNRIVKFKPCLLAKMVRSSPVSFDLTTQLIFYDRLWVGAMYRFGDAVGGMLQMKVTKQLKVGYAYDFETNDIGAYNNGTHEILIGFDFNLGRAKVRSPRYF